MTSEAADRERVRAMVRGFLMTRRARIAPRSVGLPASVRRRVPGLRREEVALLSGISVEYYVRLERGHATGVSPGIVDTVAATLRLDDTERIHLHRLLRAIEPGHRPRERRTPAPGVGPGLRRLMDGFTDLPALAFDDKLDLVAANDLGRMLYGPVFEESPTTPNSARFTFLHEERAREFWPDWETFADHAVAVLQARIGNDPYARDVVELVELLTARSEEFRRRWAAHDVLRHTTGTKSIRHPVLGVLALPFEILEVASEPGVHVMVFTPARGSAEHDALSVLASWCAAPPHR